jgi:hypothetical protein
MKSKLYREIDRISCVDIRDYVATALNNAHNEFWIAPSSSSGEYHPQKIKGKVV